MVGTIGDGDGFARHTGDSLGEVFAIGQHLHAELHAAADDGLSRQHGWQIDGHIARRSDGKEHFDLLDGGVVDDGHFVAFLQAQVVEQGTLTCNQVADLFIIIGVHRVGKARQVGPFLLNPSDKFWKGRDELQLREFVGRKHGWEILVINHNMHKLI